MPKVVITVDGSKMSEADRIARQLDADLAKLEKTAAMKAYRAALKDLGDKSGDLAAKQKAATDAARALAAANDKLAQSMPAVSRESETMAKRLGSIKDAVGLSAINAAREMTMAVANLTRGLYETAKAGASATQARKFAEMDAALKSLSETSAKLAANLLSDSGALGVLTRQVESAENVLDKLQRATASARDGANKGEKQWYDYGLAVLSLGNPLNAMSAVADYGEDRLDDLRGTTTKATDAALSYTEALGSQQVALAQAATAQITATLAMIDSYEITKSYADTGGRGIISSADKQVVRFSETLKGSASAIQLADYNMRALAATTDATTPKIRAQAEVWTEWQAAQQPALDQLYLIDDALLTMLERLDALATAGPRAASAFASGATGMSQASRLAGGIVSGAETGRGEGAIVQGTLQDTLGLSTPMSELTAQSEALHAAMSPLAEVAAFMGDEFGQLGPVIGALGESIVNLAEGFAASADASSMFGTAIAAGKLVAGAAIKDKKALAWVNAGFEGAEAAAAYATGNIPGGIAHTVAAGLYVGVATGAVGSSAGRGAAGTATRNAGMQSSINQAPAASVAARRGPETSYNALIYTLDGSATLASIERERARGTGRKIDVRSVGSTQGRMEY